MCDEFSSTPAITDATCSTEAIRTASVGEAGRNLHHPHVRRQASSPQALQHLHQDRTPPRDIEIVTPPLASAIIDTPDHTFIPNIIDVPAGDDSLSPPSRAAFELEVKQSVAEGSSGVSRPEQFTIISRKTFTTAAIETSSSSSPPPTTFHLPLIAASPPTDSVPEIRSTWAGGSSRPQESTMIFGPFKSSNKNTTMVRKRGASSAITEYEADLTSKDRQKQKEAIRRVIVTKVKNDWSWTWPQEQRLKTPLSETWDDKSGDQQWCEREDWESNASLSDGEVQLDGEKAVDSDTGDFTIFERAVKRKARRRRRLRTEMRINDGLACFTHRRNAWTRARNLRPPQPTPVETHITKDPTAMFLDGLAEADDDDDWITEVPIAPPILPLETPLRKGITERSYITIYDKVVMQQQTPVCPINLSVVVHSCVEGWKRDGEWPPKGIALPETISAVRIRSRRAAAGSSLFSAGDTVKEKDKGVIRRSIQKVFALAHSRKNSEVATLTQTTTATNDAVGENGGAPGQDIVNATLGEHVG